MMVRAFYSKTSNCTAVAVGARRRLKAGKFVTIYCCLEIRRVATVTV